MGEVWGGRCWSAQVLIHSSDEPPLDGKALTNDAGATSVGSSRKLREQRAMLRTLAQGGSETRTSRDFFLPIVTSIRGGRTSRDSTWFTPVHVPSARMDTTSKERKVLRNHLKHGISLLEGYPVFSGC